MKKRTILGIIVVIVVTIVAIFLLRGRVGDNEINENNDDITDVSLNLKGNQDIFETINLLQPENTIEEVDEIIGFEGECTNEENKEYKWQISDNTSAKVQYTEDNDAIIEISFPGKSIANENVDFSKFDEIKEAMQTSDSMTYEQIVEKLGGVQGTLKYKSKDTVKYEWDRPDGGYLICTFKLSNMKCTYASGKF